MRTHRCYLCMCPNPSLVRCARSHPLPQVRQLEQENERLVEAEQQTAAELAQRLAEIASVGQVAHQHRVDRELLHVSGFFALAAYSKLCALNLGIDDAGVPWVVRDRAGMVLWCGLHGVGRRGGGARKVCRRACGMGLTTLHTRNRSTVQGSWRASVYGSISM